MQIDQHHFDPCRSNPLARDFFTLKETIDPNAPFADASLPAYTTEVMDALIGYGGNIRYDIPEGSKLISSRESTFIYENFDLEGEVATGNLDVISTSSYFEDATETLNGNLGSYIS